MNTLLNNMYTTPTIIPKQKSPYLMRSSDFAALLGIVLILIVTTLLYLTIQLTINHNSPTSETIPEQASPQQLWHEYV